MQRIKYTQTSNPNVYQTEAFIQTYSKGLVRAEYDLSSLTYKVTSHLGTELIAEGTGTSKHKILIKIKNEIIKLGAPDIEPKEKRQERK